MRLAFMDESGRSGDTEFVGMSVCDARWPVWQEFNRRWQAVLDAHQAPYLHMKDFAGSRGPFQGWTEDRRRSFLADLLSTLDGLVIDMTTAVVRPADVADFPEEALKQVGDAYLWVFQECLHAMSMAGYMEFLTERVDVVYSRQDEFRTEFRRLFDEWQATVEDGHKLGRLAFLDMRGAPGLQLADLVAYEATKYYQLKKARPDLPARYPFARLCEHQLSIGSGGFKYIPGWKLRLKLTGDGQVFQDLLWDDVDRWLPMLRQLGPQELMTEKRIRRIAQIRKYGNLDDYREGRVRRER